MSYIVPRSEDPGATPTAADTLLLGGIPERSEVELNRFVDDAADEIDSIIGYIYKTPVNNSADGLPLAQRSPVRLTLSRINRYLASGRYVMAVAASGEDDSLHSYASRLVREALDALRDIVNGKVLFDAERIADEDALRKGPRISNAEAASNVDAFYGAYTGTDGMMFGARTSFNVGRLESE